MRLYHVREHDRPGALDARDEEECFTGVGKRTGVFLSTEASTGDRTMAADVDPELVSSFEVTADGAPHREFVVPGAVVATIPFVAC